jgi:predicted nucleic acid-binding protein
VILVDTNAWIHFLRRGDPRLSRFLVEQRVRTCDVVVGELALGSGLPRGFRSDLEALPHLPCPTANETWRFIERHLRSFAGAGVGWADAQILITAVNAGAWLHTSDRAVKKVAQSLGVRSA